jgi:tetratricopeptide (TPR) repeat protein
MTATGASSPQSGVTLPSTRVFISYAHDDTDHQRAVQSLWVFLRQCGIDACVDLTAAEEPQDWPAWMADQLRACDYVLVVGSPEYRRRAEGRAEPDVGRGVRWEARQVQELLYRDRDAGRRRVLPVLLPGRTVEDLPDWLTPVSSTTYRVTDYSVAGMEPLYRVLTGQRRIVEPPLGQVVVLGTEDLGLPAGPVPDVSVPVSGPLRTEVLVRAEVSEGRLATELVVAGGSLGRRSVPVPVDAWRAWAGLRLGPAAAVERMTSAGVALGRAVFDDASAVLVADLISGLRPGDGVDVVLVGDGAAATMPIELLRLPDPRSAEVQPPLALRAGVTVRRQLSQRSECAPPLAGPLKVLAAVAAPDESRTENAPLDVEAEMQAVLGAVQPLAGHENAQAQILEVASLEQIRSALEADAYHVLHLSAHGSPTEVELEDEDGDPHLVTAQQLMDGLRRAGRPVPLIVLSACSGAATASETIATELIRQGADRVIAMQAPVTDRYATRLAAALYRRLAGAPELPVGQALAKARWDVEAGPGDEDRERLPEYAVATLLSAGGDGPLVDVAATVAPLSRVTVAPSGKSVRELSMGQLIGRRRELRTATAVLRRTPEAVERFGVVAGVQLTGIGGIGKTALAGRLVGRMRESGWLVAVHEGAWTPDALFAAVAAELSRVSGLADVAETLAAGGEDDYPKLNLVRQVLARLPVLLVFDDFEQNLTVPGGGAFADPAFGELFRELCAGAETGALLVTCRYPVPGLELDLLDVALGGLSPAELGRLFLRLPAIRDLDDPEDRRLIARAIGGHPRLIEFVDALIRGRGAAGLREVQDRLRTLARETGVDLRKPQEPGDAVNAAMLLGSADILLDPLLGLLTDTQRDALTQVAVSRAPMSVDDLAFALQADHVEGVRADVERVAALTLVSVRDDQLDMHPWTGELITRNTSDDEQLACHERALKMRVRRFEEGTARYPDLLEVPRHLARLGRYDDLVATAREATTLLNGTLARTAYLGELRPLIPTAERAWILLGELELNALIAVGDLVRAADLVIRIHREVQTRAESDPSNTEWQRDLSVSHNKVGDLAVAAGDLTAARTAYQAGHDIRQRLATTDPTNTEWQRDLSLSHERVGDLAVAAGDLATARTAYQAALDIAQRLATTDPTNTTWQRDLSISHERLGDFAVAAGDTTTASTAYQASLDIRQRLTTIDPSNTAWQRDLSISHNKIGDLAVAAGDAAAASTAYRAALDIAQHLAATDPTNTEWQRDLSISHERLGDLAVAAGDRTTARTAYQAGLDIRQRLTGIDPSNAAWQRDLSVSHNKIGDLAVAAGDLSAARTAYQAGLDIRQRLAATDPSNTAWQRDLSVSHDRLGDLARAAGDPAAASTAYQAGIDIAQRLSTTDPTNTTWQRDLSVSHNKIGDLAVAAGDPATARTAYQAGLDIAQRLTATDPTNIEWQHDLSVSHNKIGDLAVAAGDPATARTAYQAGLDIRQRLTATDPTNTEWQRALAISHERLGDAAAAAGDPATARTAYQASLAIAQRLASIDPTNAELQELVSFVEDRLSELDEG